MEDTVARLIGDSPELGFLLFGAIFLGGVAMGFGPCTLPMVPAVLGIVARRVGGTEGIASLGPLRAFATAGVFVLGMATTFAGMGAVAGAVGGVLLAAKWASYVLAALLAVLGLQLLGVVNIDFSRFGLSGAVTGGRRKGLLGVLALGLLFGLVASPCATPALVAVSTLAAAQGSPAAGAGMLFVFGLGKGMPFLLVGAASGVITTAMRRTTRVADVLTKLGGVALIGVALWLIWSA